MPEICRFYGIIITMYAVEHNPPHFHARFGDYRVQIDIESGDVIEGFFPRKQLRLLQAWVELHRNDLISNWEETKKENPQIHKIEPLK